MKEQLKALLALAEIDNEINSLREIREARPRQLEPFRSQEHGRAERVAMIRQELKRLRRESDRIEQEIRECEEKLTKLKIQINQAKSNEEYQVLTEQKNRLEEEVGAKEEEGLETLSKSEKLGEELKEAEEAWAEAKRELEQAESEVAAEIAEIDKRLEELAKQRAEVASKVESKYLSQYERVLNRHHDRAVVPVQGGVCQGCFMSVTPQMVNSLMIGREIVVCKSCQRILYLPDMEA